MKNLKFLRKGNFAIEIPRLKSRGGSLKLPLRDYVKGGFLADDKQIISVSDDEAKDLMRCWPTLFEEIKQTKKADNKIEKMEVENG